MKGINTKKGKCTTIVLISVGVVLLLVALTAMVISTYALVLINKATTTTTMITTTTSEYTVLFSFRYFSHAFDRNKNIV
jgi:flagellar basal body-associated protein FliL